MDWLLPSSANTLETLEFGLCSTSITKTPLQLSSFKNLRRLEITNNYGDNMNMVISAGSIFSVNPIARISFLHSQVTSVEEGAFQGKNISLRIPSRL